MCCSSDVDSISPSCRFGLLGVTSIDYSLSFKRWSSLFFFFYVQFVLTGFVSAFPADDLITAV